MVKFRQTISPGQQGRDVKAVKDGMRRMHVDGSGAMGKSGYAGPAFVRCIKKVQRHYGLHQDGIYGEATHARIAPHFTAFDNWRYRTAAIRTTPQPIPPAYQHGTLPILLPFAWKEGFNPSAGQINQGRHAPGSYHYMDRAVDMSGTTTHMRQAFLDAIHTFGVPRIEELFYDPMGYYVKNGRVVGGQMGGHTSHVHLAL